MKTALCVTFCLILSAGLSVAGILVPVSVDEFGNGSGIADVNTSFADPLNGNTRTVAYLLPFLTVAGDVLLTESLGGVQINSDLYRFEPISIPNHSVLVVYSDTESRVGDSPADVGLPGVLQTNVITLLEVGSEGSNGFFGYQPTAGQPGYISSDFTANYSLISDSPEPATVVLVALPLGVLFFRRKLFR